MDSFGFLWRERIEGFPLLALPFALGLSCDDTWQKRILFLVVPLQMTQIFSHSVNRLSLCQLMRNPLHANFSEMQVIFDNGMHRAIANSDLNTNLFIWDSSVFPDQILNPRNHIRLEGSVPGANRLVAMCVLRRISSATRTDLSGTYNVHQQTCDNEFRVFQHPQPQETNHTSLLFFYCLHFQCWTNTLYTTHTSITIKKQLCGSVRFHYACLLPCNDM